MLIPIEIISKSLQNNISSRKSGVRLPKSRTNGELQWFFFLVFKQCHRHAIVIMWKIRKQEINEARGLFSLWVADSNKKERCSPTKKMIRFPWNRNNLMLTARASNRQCLTAWQRSRCWWWRSSPTWTWWSARTSSPSTNLCWLHTPNYSQVEEPPKYLLLCDWASPGILGECLEGKEDKAAMKTSSVQFLDKVCVKFHPMLTSRNWKRFITSYQSKDWIRKVTSYPLHQKRF